MTQHKTSQRFSFTVLRIQKSGIPWPPTPMTWHLTDISLCDSRLYRSDVFFSSSLLQPDSSANHTVSWSCKVRQQPDFPPLVEGGQPRGFLGHLARVPIPRVYGDPWPKVSCYFPGVMGPPPYETGSSAARVKTRHTTNHLLAVEISSKATDLLVDMFCDQQSTHNKLIGQDIMPTHKQERGEEASVSFAPPPHWLLLLEVRHRHKEYREKALLRTAR